MAVSEPATFAYDAAPAIIPGRRTHQEDAIAVDFAEGVPFGFVVLADGMGGHAAGDVASKIVVTRVFCELKMLARDPARLEHAIGEVMTGAAKLANECVGLASNRDRTLSGMGSTLVAPVIFENRLYWISVGDSPLYLFRGSRLFRLNDEHSFARRMDKLVAEGRMSPEVAAEHPDRDCLTSVLYGRSISEIDCRSTPIRLLDGDVLIAASDGLQYIGEQKIARILHASKNMSSSEITSNLLRSIYKLDDPNQDNVAFCVLKIRQTTPREKTEDRCVETIAHAEASVKSRVATDGELAPREQQIL